MSGWERNGQYGYIFEVFYTLICLDDQRNGVGVNIVQRLYRDYRVLLT